MSAALKFRNRPDRIWKSDMDFEKFYAGCAGDLTLIRDLIDLFNSQVPKQFEHAQNAIASRDPATIEMAAHRLKGSLAIFHSNKAVASAQDLEAQAKTGDLQRLNAAVRNLTQQIADLADDLQFIKTEWLHGTI